MNQCGLNLPDSKFRYSSLTLSFLLSIASFNSNKDSDIRYYHLYSIGKKKLNIFVVVVNLFILIGG